MTNPLGGFGDLVLDAPKLDDAHYRQHDGKQPGQPATKQHSERGKRGTDLGDEWRVLVALGSLEIGLNQRTVAVGPCFGGAKLGSG